MNRRTKNWGPAWPPYPHLPLLPDIQSFAITEQFDYLLDLSLDSMTPYFSRRFRELASKEYCLLSVLCLQESPVTQVELAYLVGADQAASPGVNPQSIIAQSFRNLQRKKAVVKTAIGYLPADHVCAWYRMRMGILSMRGRDIRPQTILRSVYTL